MITPPMQAVDSETMIDVPRLRAYRQNRLREAMKEQGLDAVILDEPLSIRYATGCEIAPYSRCIFRRAISLYPPKGQLFISIVNRVAYQEVSWKRLM